ncbi:MAG: hypothetical protein EBR82_79670, partial [Caulobacteraceae bacterium]|nr:hypothetical protein [Caulobacteraceae bacterium]
MDRVSYGPLTLFESDAYKQAKSMKAEEDALKIEKLRLDLAKARDEQEMASPSGRSTRAAEVAAFLEQEKQKEFGVPIGEEVGAKMTAQGGPSILEATKMQGQLDVEARARQARVDAAKNYLAGERSLLPTASVDVAGVKQTVLAPQVGKTTADINEQIFQAQVPQLTKAYVAQGYDPDTAVKMAGSDVTKNLFKAQSSGKVVLTSNDGMSTISYTNEQAQRMWKDPSTPKFIKTQLNNFFGESEQPAAANWIK